MNPEASFIQIGDTYYATIKRGNVEDVIKERGVNKPFDSATRAMNAALKAIESAKRIEIPDPPPTSPEKDLRIEMVDRWRQERLAQRQADREAATLMGIEVVVKRKRPKCHAKS